MSTLGKALLAAAAVTLTACGTRPPPGLGGAGGNTGVCQHTCTPDPGSRLTNCAAEETGLEFFDAPDRLPLWNFDPAGSNATTMYSYTDKTALIATFADPDTGDRKTWEPPTQEVVRCGTDKTGVIHIQGGPFLGWGGGVGIAMRDFHNRACGPNPDGSLPAHCLPPTSGPLFDQMLDVSAWEGVSFWGRRGPDSQVGIRVGVGDKYTDDDIAFLTYNANHRLDASGNPPTVQLPMYCQRVKECACLNHQECRKPLASEMIQTSCNRTNASVAPSVTPALFCGTPAVDSPGTYSNSGWTQCNDCLKDRCDDPYPAFQGSSDVDYQFNGKPCTPHVYRNGIQSSFCYDPATDPPPAETEEQCGDHWIKGVGLTSDWHLYTVPFTSLGQQGYGKRSNQLDLTAVSLIRFMWDGGWIDYYLDDIRFYRHKTQ